MSNIVAFPNTAATPSPAIGGCGPDVPNSEWAPRLLDAGFRATAYGPDVPNCVLFQERNYRVVQTYETRALIEGPDGAQRIARIAYLTPPAAANA